MEIFSQAAEVQTSPLLGFICAATNPPQFILNRFEQLLKPSQPLWRKRRTLRVISSPLQHWFHVQPEICLLVLNDEMNHTEENSPTAPGSLQVKGPLLSVLCCIIELKLKIRLIGQHNLISDRSLSVNMSDKKQGTSGLKCQRYIWDIQKFQQCWRLWSSLKYLNSYF